MTEKTELPDEVLDIISGGVFTYQGQKMTKIGRINDFGMEVKTADGTLFFPWNDKAKETFGKTFFGTNPYKAGAAALDPQTEYKLEDFAGDPQSR